MTHVGRGVLHARARAGRARTPPRVTTFLIWQVLAMRDTNLRLVTFDGDCTLYSDGNNFSDRK